MRACDARKALRSTLPYDNAAWEVGDYRSKILAIMKLVVDSPGKRQFLRRNLQ